MENGARSVTITSMMMMQAWYAIIWASAVQARNERISALVRAAYGLTISSVEMLHRLGYARCAAKDARREMQERLQREVQHEVQRRIEAEARLKALQARRAIPTAKRPPFAELSGNGLGKPARSIPEE